MNSKLTFTDLRAANEARQEHWGGSDNWTLADWSNAVAGEVGEACNIVKKIRRPELGTTGNGKDVSAYYGKLEVEIGDVLIYLDLLAKKAGTTLDQAVMRAFNEKSEQLAMPVRLTPLRTTADTEQDGKGVKVKGLEWSSEPPYSVARVFRGFYSTEWIEEAGICELRGTFMRGEFATVSAAKAAAQANHDRHVRSCLDLSTLSNAPQQEAEPVAYVSCPGCSGTGDQGANPSYGACDDCGGLGKIEAVTPRASPPPVDPAPSQDGVVTRITTARAAFEALHGYPAPEDMSSPYAPKSKIGQAFAFADAFLALNKGGE